MPKQLGSVNQYDLPPKYRAYGTTYLDGGQGNRVETNSSNSGNGVDRSGTGTISANTGTEFDYSALGFALAPAPNRQYWIKGGLWSVTTAAGAGLRITIRSGTALTGTIVWQITVPVPLISGAFEPYIAFQGPWRPNPGSAPSANTNYFLSFFAVGQNVTVKNYPSSPNNLPNCVEVLDDGLYTS